MYGPPLALASLLALGMLLGGCAAIVGTAGIAGTGTVAVDQRTLGTMVEDETIERKTLGALHRAGLLGEDGRHRMKVTSFNRIALLTGQVPDEETKGRAGDVAKRVDQVRGVHNELVIGKPTSFATRTEDAAVTLRAKVALLAARDLRPPANVNPKIVTEDGVVFLMGLVTRAQAEAITAAVQTSVPGVRQIVRLFEYLDSPADDGGGFPPD